MTVAGTGTLVHLPFPDRPEYGSPYPEGIAVGHIDITGDASGGAITSALSAEGRFLYRLELLNATKGTAIANIANYITAHRWATERSGLGAQAFDLNWIPSKVDGAAFSVYRPESQDLEMIRRFPIGRTDRVDLQVITSFFWQTNEDLILYDVDWVFTYWPSTALYRPGFLASFWESPFIPTFT